MLSIFKHILSGSENTVKKKRLLRVLLAICLCLGIICMIVAFSVFAAHKYRVSKPTEVTVIDEIYMSNEEAVSE